MTGMAITLLNTKYKVQSLGRSKSPRIFVNAIPKTGTNLVVSLAQAYGRVAISGPVIAAAAASGTFAGKCGLVFGHVENLSEDLVAGGFDDAFLLVRRPEGYVMSLARYIEANKRHPLHRALGHAEMDVLLRAIVEGTTVDSFALAAIDERYRAYIGNARSGGLKIVDFDELRGGPPHRANSAALMRAIGGPDYHESFAQMLAKSKRLSTTFQHSARSQLQGELPEDIRQASSFRSASRIYDDSLSD